MISYLYKKKKKLNIEEKKSNTVTHKKNDNVCLQCNHFTTWSDTCIFTKSLFYVLSRSYYRSWSYQHVSANMSNEKKNVLTGSLILDISCISLEMLTQICNYAG